MIDTKTEILEELAAAMLKYDIKPDDLINELVEVRKIPLSRRAALGLGLGAAALSFGAGSALAGSVATGTVASAEGQFAKLSGTDGTEIQDMSQNYLDLSNKGFFKLPEHLGPSAPGSIVAGSLYWDTSV